MNRIYSSEQARFLQPDPIGMASVDLTDPQSLNLYTYARNNPIDFTDPTGLYGGAIISNCRVKCWETSVEILDDGDGSGALFSDVSSSSGCSMTCSVSWVLVQPISPPSERGGVYGDGFVQDQDPDEGCNKKIAALFGGKGAEVATRLDMLRRLGKFYGKIFDRSDHLYKSGVFHIYSDESGDPDKDTALYVPKGAWFIRPSRKTAGEYQSRDGEWQNSFSFILRGEYEGVTVTFVHVAGTYGGKYGAAYLGKKYINSKGRLIGKENESGTSVQIGVIGGLAGEGSKSGGYRHTHAVVRLNGRKTDPREVFCSPKRE